MKRSICLVLFAAALSVLSYSYTYADSFQKELLGKWEDKNDQNSTVEFLDGGIFFAVVGDQKLTGDYKVLKENLFSFSLMGFKGTPLIVQAAFSASTGSRFSLPMVCFLNRGKSPRRRSIFLLLNFR